MSIDTEFYGRSRFESKGDRKASVKLTVKFKGPKLKPQSSWRAIVFEALLPGVFVVLIYYHFFIYSPETPQFYSSLLEKCLHG
jgi:hypothetical protein